MDGPIFRRPQGTLAGLHVLFFDERTGNPAPLGRLLRESGATVTLVTTAAEALGVVRSVIPDVIVARLLADGPESAEFDRRLAELSGGPNGAIPAIALGGAARPGPDPARAAFAARHPESARPEQVIATVARLASRRARRAEPATAGVSAGAAAPRRLGDPRGAARPNGGSAAAVRLPDYAPSARRQRPNGSAAGLAFAHAPAAASAATENRMLAWLAGRDGGFADVDLKPTDLRAGDVLYAPGDTVDTIVLPAGAVLSLSTLLTSGTAVEVAVIGKDGAYAGCGPLAGGVALHRVSAAIGGRAYKLRLASAPAGALERLAPALAWVNAATSLQTAQTAACAAAHSVRERLCRWLCAAMDAAGPELTITHEAIARALAVRRAGITVVLGELCDEGVLASSRGRLRVLDRVRLERAACECYATVRDESEALWSRLVS